MSTDSTRQAIATAKQEIIELRMRYARATDLIGAGTAGQTEGRQIYHEIFAPDASIGAQGIDPVTGPDAWFDVVDSALDEYAATQHLIGSALVQEINLPDEKGNGGNATMTSYLQAWHSRPDNSLYMFYGTYNDNCAHSPEAGWQIKHMRLVRITDEMRYVTPRAGGLESVGNG